MPAGMLILLVRKHCHHLEAILLRLLLHMPLALDLESLQLFLLLWDAELSASFDLLVSAECLLVVPLIVFVELP